MFQECIVITGFDCISSHISVTNTELWVSQINCIYRKIKAKIKKIKKNNSLKWNVAENFLYTAKYL